MYECMNIHGCKFIIKINRKVNQFLYKVEVGLSPTNYCFELDLKHLIYQQDNVSIQITKNLRD
jgi:hypothetical protein